jgi:hypothetical protein
MPRFEIGAHVTGSSVTCTVTCKPWVIVASGLDASCVAVELLVMHAKSEGT